MREAMLLSEVSPALRVCWAKSGDFDGSSPRKWLPLVGHAMDAAGVMGHLWDAWLDGHQRELLTTPFVEAGPSDPEQAARSALVFLAAAHDTGKLSIPFVAKVPDLARRMREPGGLDAPELDDVARAQRRQFLHGQVGEVIVDRCLRDEGISGQLAHALASVVGAHHGMTIDKATLRNVRESEYLWGDRPGAKVTTAWDSVHHEFVDFGLDLSGVREILRRPIALPMSFLVIASGLTIVADWIASSELFALTDFDDTDFHYLDEGGESARVARACESLVLPSPWQAVDSGEDPDVFLQRRFGFDDSVQARPIQRAAVDAARTGSGPGMLLIEDTMGAGKTEAGVLAAETFAARLGASGFMFALPTQATTDAMFGRMLTYLSTVADDKVAGAAQDAHTELTTSLLHGRSWLNPESGALVRSGKDMQDQAIEVLGGVGDVRGIGIDGAAHSDEALTVVHPWLSGHKKAILAEFVTSTIDHVLLGGLKSKHLALRHLGLTQKIVVIDEAHASSDFMNVFLEIVLEWLGYYGVGVVILSATLHQDLRQRFAWAYMNGLDESGLLASEDELDTYALDAPGTDVGYPRITRIQADGVSVRGVAAALPPSTVTVVAEPCGTDPGAVADLVDSLYGNGGCVLVVRNTVGTAQSLYEELRRRHGEDVLLMHSRFTAADRLANDQRLLGAFGKQSADTHRPDKAIVVATQVVEQSLDIDFDVLISDVAPVDILLQRIGRIHRHGGRTRPIGMTEPVCHVIGMPTDTTAGPELDRGSSYVYGEWALLRTALVLRTAAGPEGMPVHLPEDVGHLVEEAFSGDYLVPEAWRSAYDKAGKEREKKLEKARADARTFLLAPPPGSSRSSATLDGWLSLSAEADDEGRAGYAKVRDGDDTLDVILVEERDGALRLLPGTGLADSTLIPTDRVPKWNVARALAMSTVKLPASLTYPRIVDRVIADLTKNYWQAWQESPRLAGQLVLVLHEGEAEVAGKRITYSQETGLRVEGKEQG